MERSLIPRAVAGGARLLPRSKAITIAIRRGTATGVVVRQDAGKVFVGARKAVILAAGAVQSPLLLKRSGMGGAMVGKNFQVHLGVSVTAEMRHPVRETEGPPQGIEVTEFSDRGIKLATQLLPPELLLARTTLQGEALVDLLGRADFVSSWTGSVRAEARGEIRRGVLGQSAIRLVPTRGDMERLRESVYRMCRLLLALGAVRVFPGIHGAPQEVRRTDESEAVRNGPLDARCYMLGAGHLFGTCKMGGNPRTSVVTPGFRHHQVDGLYIVDASVFPTNTGVNPQHSIMAMAMAATRSIAADGA